MAAVALEHPPAERAIQLMPPDSPLAAPGWPHVVTVRCCAEPADSIVVTTLLTPSAWETVVLPDTSAAWPLVMFHSTTPRPMSCRSANCTSSAASASATRTPPSAFGPVRPGSRCQRSDFER